MIMMLEFEDEKRATIANLRKRLKPIEHDILRGNRFYGKEAVHTENSEYFSSAQGNPQTSSVIRSLVSVGKPLSRKLSLAKIKLTKRQAVSPQTITNIKKFRKRLIYILSLHGLPGRTTTPVCYLGFNIVIS
jgi:hypothetical protein